MIAREAKTLLDGLLSRFGFVPIKELQDARDDLDCVIDKIDQGKRIVIVKSKESLFQHKFVDREVIVHGHDINIEQCIFKNSDLIVTKGSKNVDVRKCQGVL